jgi:outer membrane protein assembly factor BamB/Ca2+-binding EF-hand superfamily protein
MFHATARHLFFVVATLSTACAAKADDWPQWRGLNRDGKSSERGLRSNWPEGGPPVAWHVENAGVGYSSLAIMDGRVFTQGDLDGVEHVHCWNEADGALLWAVQPEPVAAALDERVGREFARLDRNSDGMLDLVESLSGLGLSAGLMELRGEGDEEAIARERAGSLVQQLDQDGNGRLTFVELPRAAVNELLSQVDRPDGETDAQALAEQRAKQGLKLDKNGDAQVSRDESRGTLFELLFNRIDQPPPGERRGDDQLTETELTTYFATREQGRDGELTVEELAAYFHRTFPGRDGVYTRDDVRRHFGGFRNNQGDGPRGTPTIDGDRVYAEGGNGDVTCLNAETGATIWHVNLASDLGGGRPGWGYSESPLVMDDLVIVTPGGRQGTLAALNKDTGEVVWRSDKVQEGAHYSSPIAGYIAGTRQVLQFARESVFGVSIEDGSLLWKYSGANNGTANCSTPIIDGDYVLVSSAYGTGAGMVKVAGDPTAQAAEQVYFQKVLENHHGGLVKIGDHVYGTNNQTLLCVYFPTGEIAWRARGVGKGSLVYADGHLYCLSERNDVVLVEVNPAEFVEKGRFRIPSTGRPSWAHPVVANGRLYIRDQERLTAYDVRAE